MEEKLIAEKCEQKWMVIMTEDFRFEMICPICGYSFTGNKIEVRRKCDKCGARLFDRDGVFLIGRSGELIEEKSSGKGNDGADNQHQDVSGEPLYSRFLFRRKLRKIILAGSRKRN